MQDQAQGSQRGYYPSAGSRLSLNIHRLLSDSPGYMPHANFKKPIAILVLGPHGSGKSAFVDVATRRPGRNDNLNPDPCSCPATGGWINNEEFNFIELQGFDNPELSDWYILETMLRTFCSPKPAYQTYGYHRPFVQASELLAPEILSGIIYIHPDEDSQAGRTPVETIRTLVGLLGESYLNRLTVLVQSKSKTSPPNQESTTHDFSQTPDSPLYPFYATKNEYKPCTEAFTLDPLHIARILSRFVGVLPGLFWAQERLVDASWNVESMHLNLRNFVSGRVGYLSVPDQPSSVLLGQKDEALRSMNEQLEQLNGSLQEKDEELERLRKAVEVGKLRDKLRDMDQRRKKSGEESAVKDSKAPQANNKELEVLRKLLTAQEQRNEELERSIEKLDGEGRENIKELDQLRKDAKDKDQELQNIRMAVKARTKAWAEELEVLCGSVPGSEERSSSEHDQPPAELEKITQKDEEIRRLQDAIREKDEEIGRLKSSGIKDSKSADHGEIRSSSSGIRAGYHSQQIAVGYASHHIPAHAEERIEQAQITQGLKDINRIIEDLSQDISNYLVDHFSPIATPIEASFRSRELLHVLGYTGRNPPSVKALGPHLDPGTFFFYIVQAILCYQLYIRLFEPFHPGIVETKLQNELLNDMYMQMMYREPQSVTGRWRMDSFNSISAVASQSSDRALYQALLDSVYILLRGCFDTSVEVTLDTEHETMLRRLVDMAGRWNQLIKGSVVLLGEFQPTAYPCGDGFRSDYMVEAMESGGAKQIQSILGTVGLGLIRYIALGDNQEPEKTILYQAVVVSEKSFG